MKGESATVEIEDGIGSRDARGLSRVAAAPDGKVIDREEQEKLRRLIEFLRHHDGDELLFPSEERGAMDWEAANGHLQEIVSPQSLVELYRNLKEADFATYALSDERPAIHDEGDTVRRNLIAFQEFANILFGRLASSAEGFQQLIGAITHESRCRKAQFDGSLCFDGELRASDRSVQDYIRSVMVHAMFTADPEKSRRIFSQYLLSLDEKRETYYGEKHISVELLDDEGMDYFAQAAELSRQ